MLDLDREIGGLTCRDVLAHLSDYVDGELDSATIARVHEHLRGCDQCTRFGGQLGAVLTELRARLTTPVPLDAARAQRLRDRLAGA